MGVEAVLSEEAFMGSAFRDSILCNDDDLVRVPDRGEPVGDSDRRSVFGKFLKALLDPTFALIVQSAGRFIKYEDRRVL